MGNTLIFCTPAIMTEMWETIEHTLVDAAEECDVRRVVKALANADTSRAFSEATWKGFGYLKHLYLKLPEAQTTPFGELMPHLHNGLIGNKDRLARTTTRVGTIASQLRIIHVALDCPLEKAAGTWSTPLMCSSIEGLSDWLYVALDLVALIFAYTEESLLQGAEV